MDWRSLYWPGGAPPWLLAAVALALAESLRRRHRGLAGRLPAGRAWTLTGLRAALYALLVLFLSGPTLVERSERALPPRLLVLLDTSASMAVKDEAGKRTRLAAALDFLIGGATGGAPGPGATASPGATGAAGLLARLGRAYDVRVERFDSWRFPLGGDELGRLRGRLEASGPATDLIGALRAALGIGRKAGPGRSPGGAGAALPQAVVLLSDGGDTTGQTLALPGGRAYPPVISVGFGSPEGFRDISLGQVRAPRIAFQGKSVRLDVTLAVRGFTGRKLPVALTRQGRVVRTKTVDIGRSPARKTVTFAFRPAGVGSQLLAIETPLQRGEMVKSNNRVEIPLEVRRDKIRVLTISGAPSWNYRFLRMALKRDPAIDLVSFVFLRTSEDDPGVPTQELSLVPFPVDKLFLEELKNFEVVVFDNFSAVEYFSNYYLERVRDYVRQGGGFLMFGGKRSFSAGGYYRSPVEALLPVSLARLSDYRSRLRAGARLTPTGARHPVTRLSADPEANGRLWARLPALRAVNLPGPPGSGQILVSASGPYGEAPLIGARRVGEGRVLSVFTDDLWRWNFGMVADGRSNRLYIRLIAQMIRWLSGDPSSSQVQILPEAEQGEEGAYVVRIQVRDDDYRPARSADVRLSLRDPYGTVRRLKAEFRPETGEFEARFRPRGMGSYRAEVAAMQGGRPIGHSVRSLRVGREAGGAEWADASPRWDLLRAAAAGTGGLFLPAGASAPESADALRGRVVEALRGRVPPRVTEVRDVRLWSLPGVVLLLILLPGAEWTLRRLWGLA